MEAKSRRPRALAAVFRQVYCKGRIYSFASEMISYINKGWERSRTLMLACLAKYGAARVVLFATVHPMGCTSIIM